MERLIVMAKHIVISKGEDSHRCNVILRIQKNGELKKCVYLIKRDAHKCD